MMLGVGLMVHFRGGTGSAGRDGIGYVVMCQVFIAFGGGTMAIGEDMAIMAASDREGVPMLLATLSLFASLGGAIGYAVSAAIYSNTFPSALRDALPDDLKPEYLAIYLGGTTNQTSWAVGTPARDAINRAWGVSERYLCIAATCMLVLGIPCIAAWKNYSVDRRQDKGKLI